MHFSIIIVYYSKVCRLLNKPFGNAVKPILNQYSLLIGLPIAKFPSVKFFVDNSAKSCMLCFVHNTKSTLIDCLQVC